jgi:hypothetical protein
MNPEANCTFFFVSRFAGCLNMDSRNSSDPEDKSVKSGSFEEVENLAGPSMFDEPDFLATVALGFCDATSGGGEAEQATPVPTFEIERQRLLRQASEISKRLKQQQQELDRREANLQAANAALQGEQRTWRLQSSHDREELAAIRQTLAQEEAALQVKAKELAAWEAAVMEDVHARQAVLDSKEAEVSSREIALAEQLRTFHHQQHELDRKQTEYAQNLAMHDAEQRIQAEALSADRRDLKQELDRWAAEQQNWTQLKSRVELFFREQQMNMRVGEQSTEKSLIPEQVAPEAERASGVASVAAKVHQHGVEFEQELVRIQEAFESLVAATLDRLEPQTQVAGDASEIRENVSQLGRHMRGILETSETTLNALRAENQAWLTQIESRLRELATEERGIVQSVRAQLDQIRGQWLQLDSAHGLAAPHFLRQPDQEASPDAHEPTGHLPSP